MKINKELKMLSSEQLKERLEVLQKDLIKLNAQVAMHTQIQNPGVIKKTKKTIAKIMCYLAKKE